GVRLFQGLLNLGTNVSVEFLAQSFERDARDELYLSLLGKSQTFHNRQQVGDIMARATNDVRQLNFMINPGLSLIFTSILNLVVPLVIIATIRLELLLMPLIFTALFAVALRRYNDQLNPVVGGLRMQFGVMNSGLNEAIGGIEVVKAFAQEQSEQGRFTANATKYRDLLVRQGFVQARYLPLLLLVICYALGFGHALILWRQGALSIGQVIAFMGLFDLLRFPTFISLFSFSLVQLGLAGAQRILKLITTETELDENAAGISRPIEGALTFENVSFRFEPDEAPAGPPAWGGAPATPAAPKQVLSDISFSARPGETIAIVGQTGAGKSTLTRLVNRTYDASSGRVLIDGSDVRDWNLQSLRSQISTIEQDIFLFSRSIADNIAFGAAGNATREQIEEAARQAQAHDFITGFPDGYDTVVGERGVTLSGGQRQRIAIARAFLTNPRILILDDSTSAIDSATEDQIQQAMRRILTGRTTLLITHRLSQIRWADRILVLRAGRLVDSGTHDELLARSEAYQRIFARYS
ncbi:MAG: ABC transporter ATP-binding protein, partial [Chloroflexales bacterium]|nr:ABC transporter ATP-binding protein [Chloroflexales bacterium]